MAKNVMIMGATSGIGLELAEQFAALGCDLALAGRRADALKAAAEKIHAKTGVRIETSVIDVCSETAPLELARLSARIGGIDIYIHSSGIGQENPELDPETELRIVRTNALGFVRCVDSAYTLLRSGRRGGQIAVLSSVACVRGLGAAPAYSATKAMQANYLEGLRQHIATKRLDITVTDIRPGFVDTPLLHGKRYPLTMETPYAARRIVKAILGKKRVAWIDWRYGLLAFAWRLLPGALWERVPAGFTTRRKAGGGQ